jgi:hypothetical protein
MSNLVQVPWQPEYWLTPDTLAYLVAASDRLDTELQLTDGWRSYAAQKALYDFYLADKANHPVASNPDTGQRNHMRGGAFDLARTDPTVQAACRAVGLVRDPEEPWHWNNPNWANMPIIPTNYGAAPASAGNVSPLGGFLMALSDSEQAELLTKTRSVFDALFSGGAAMPDSKKSVGQSLADIHAIVGQGVRRGDKVLSQIQDNADTRTIVGQIQAGLGNLTPAGSIDYDKLAAAITKTAGAAPSADAVAAAVVKLLGGKLSA